MPIALLFGVFALLIAVAYATTRLTREGSAVHSYQRNKLTASIVGTVAFAVFLVIYLVVRSV
jgi:Mn2+/Fe2+ NRAMP family transporter